LGTFSGAQARHDAQARLAADRRPVPGFSPTAATFTVSVAQMDELRAGFAEAADAGLLHPDAASPAPRSRSAGR
jgi:hypothetical protein